MRLGCCSCLGRFPPLVPCPPLMQGPAVGLPTGTLAKHGHSGAWPVAKTRSWLASLLLRICKCKDGPLAKHTARPSPYPRLCTPALGGNSLLKGTHPTPTPSSHPTPDPSTSWGDPYNCYVFRSKTFVGGLLPSWGYSVFLQLLPFVLRYSFLLICYFYNSSNFYFYLFL